MYSLDIGYAVFKRCRAAIPARAFFEGKDTADPWDRGSATVWRKHTIDWDPHTLRATS
jgi:hypothetical protein